MHESAHRSRFGSATIDCSPTTGGSTRSLSSRLSTTGSEHGYRHDVACPYDQCAVSHLALHDGLPNKTIGDAVMARLQRFPSGGPITHGQASCLRLARCKEPSSADRPRLAAFTGRHGHQVRHRGRHPHGERQLRRIRPRAPRPDGHWHGGRTASRAIRRRTGRVLVTGAAYGEGQVLSCWMAL